MGIPFDLLTWGFFEDYCKLVESVELSQFVTVVIAGSDAGQC
jgi:hypothetical protein